MTVFVLDGNENQAVAATRSLCAAGHRVVVGAETRWSKAGWSRSCAATFTYPSPADDVAGFVARVTDVCGRAGGGIVLPMTERTMLPLSEQRARLEAVGATFILPSHEQVLRACSKKYMGRIAAKLGLAVPETWELGGDEAEAVRLAGELSYPVVLKPAMSHEPVGGRMQATGAPLYARDRAQFIAQWRALIRRSRAVVVQRFVEGGGAGYFALVQHGRVVAEFAHRRIRDVRPTGSGSAVRESVAVDPALSVPARRLLEAIGWHGVAMVEYRRTPEGTPVFLEVNPRFWTSLPLAIASGVDFPRLLVEMAQGGSVEAPTYRVGVRCRWWLGDTQHLMQALRGAPPGYPGVFPSRWETLRSFVTPRRGTVHDNFRWTDPLPEAGDWLHFIARRVPAWLERGRRSRVDIANAQGRPAHP